MSNFDLHEFSDMVTHCREKKYDGLISDDNISFSLDKLNELTAHYSSQNYSAMSEQTFQADEIIKKFKIEKDKPAIYLDIASANDVRRNARQAVGIFDKLIDQTERIINFDKNSRKNNSSSKIILSQIIKIRNNYDDKTKKLIYQDGKEPIAFHDLLEKYIEYTSKTIRDFIEIVVMGVWRGFSSDSIYNDITHIVNAALKEFGVYTADIRIGGGVNFDICTIADDDGNEKTDIAEKIDCIKKIQRYPYLFSDDNIILTGKVNVWRKSK